MATYFAGVQLFDGRTVRSRAGVLVANGRIEWVGPHRRAPRAARAAHEVDGAGRTLTPGLIDCHVHLCFDGSADFQREGEEVVGNDALAALKALRNGRRHLEHGVTTVRDLGGPSGYACAVAAAIEDGVADGPTVVAAGRALTISGGHGHGAFAYEVDGPENVRRAVREQMRSGARVIKVIATGGVLTPGITADFAAFTPEELAAAVDEAHKWNRGIAAHAIGGTGIENAVRAGIDSIEHGSQISVGVARLMKERGTFHVPTISALRGILDNADEVADYAVEKAALVLSWARDSFRRAVREGVRHAAGTDAGTPFNPHGSLPLEIERMVEWGLTPLKALQSATSNAAELLRVPHIGRIQPGMAGDVALYEGEPLDEVSLLATPTLVLKRGDVAAGRLP
ncbi:MAG TPA: amidohydrolase family protein [Actinomycetota bacterium]|nr:amidohydrolase family protein [Actinomycetota bacterium]